MNISYVDFENKKTVPVIPDKPEEPMVSEFAMGDVNRDGKVTSTDAIFVLQCAVRMQTPDAEQKTLADDGEGIITTTGALMIL